VSRFWVRYNFGYTFLLHLIWERARQTRTAQGVAVRAVALSWSSFCEATTSQLPARFSATIVIIPNRRLRAVPSGFLSPAPVQLQ